MNVTEKFPSFPLFGAEWVLWLLIVLSVVSVAVMIERWRYFAARRVDFDQLAMDLRRFAREADHDGAMKKYGHADAIETIVGLAGVRGARRGAGGGPFNSSTRRARAAVAHSDAIAHAVLAELKGKEAA